MTRSDLSTNQGHDARGRRDRENNGARSQGGSRSSNNGDGPPAYRLVDPAGLSETLLILHRPGRLYVDREGVASALRASPQADPVRAAHMVCAWASDPTLRNRNAAALMLRALPEAISIADAERAATLRRGGPDPERRKPPEGDTAGWAPVAEALRDKVPDFKFAIWLSELELVATRHRGRRRHLVVRAPDHIRTWVRDRYLPLILDAARHVHGTATTVEVVDERWLAPLDGSEAAGQLRLDADEGGQT